MSGTEKLTARRGYRSVASLALVLSLMCATAGANGRGGAGPQSPSAPTGTIRYPCADPTLTKRGLTPNGTCGYMLNVTGGGQYTLHPRKPADLDIYFYNASGQYSASAGPPGFCGDLSGSVPSDAVKVVVVTSPSNCAAEQGGSFEGSQVDVKFDYSG